MGIGHWIGLAGAIFGIGWCVHALLSGAYRKDR